MPKKQKPSSVPDQERTAQEYEKLPSYAPSQQDNEQQHDDHDSSTVQPDESQSKWKWRLKPNQRSKRKLDSENYEREQQHEALVSYESKEKPSSDRDQECTAQEYEKLPSSVPSQQDNEQQHDHHDSSTVQPDESQSKWKWRLKPNQRDKKKVDSGREKQPEVVMDYESKEKPSSVPDQLKFAAPDYGKLPSYAESQQDQEQEHDDQDSSTAQPDESRSKRKWRLKSSQRDKKKLDSEHDEREQQHEALVSYESKEKPSSVPDQLKCAAPDYGKLPSYAESQQDQEQEHDDHVSSTVQPDESRSKRKWRLKPNLSAKKKLGSEHDEREQQHEALVSYESKEKPSSVQDQERTAQDHEKLPSYAPSQQDNEQEHDDHCSSTAQSDEGQSKRKWRLKPNLSAKKKVDSGREQHPEALVSYESKEVRLEKLQKDVDEVIEIVRANVDGILEREGKVEDLEVAAENLQDAAMEFRKTGKVVMMKYWWRNNRCLVCIASLIMLVIMIGLIAGLAKRFRTHDLHAAVSITNSTTEPLANVSTNFMPVNMEPNEMNRTSLNL